MTDEEKRRLVIFVWMLLAADVALFGMVQQAQRADRAERMVLSISKAPPVPFFSDSIAVGDSAGCWRPGGTYWGVRRLGPQTYRVTLWEEPWLLKRLRRASSR